ncbi:Phosphoesterase HXTX [Paenibacillus curdlanolyticus YK9]|uniref:Putative phosphoesterase PaecuDRAFT_0370 n=1 Tax=Paenibacillus curdlanolyticus YK9 TaxID=717606 RepID=E0I3J5_9BACL|nr:2'-5' RNA ligase family protein [Paenibacillus curdlanolyticus]EFM12859.1 Phosphoesterase HXTX [Paenibacillus curdlanolyticus YK9]
MEYGLALFPSKVIQQFANSWRKRLDPKYEHISPHMTIRESESWNTEQLTAVRAHLGQCTSQLAPVTVRINRVSTFFPASNVIYLALEKPEPVIALRHAVCTGPLALPSPTPYTFTPHITLGQNMTPDELHDAYGGLRMHTLDFPMEIRAIHLLQRTDHGIWTLYESFPLLGGQPAATNEDD